MKKNIIIVVLIAILVIGLAVGIYFISQNIGENKQVSSNNEKDDDYFILYDGIEMELKTGVQDLSDMEINQENKNKYNIKYYNFESQKYIGETGGIFGEPTYEGVSKVTNVRKIAISKKINALPRETSTVEEFPEALMQIGDYTLSDIISIDLDNDKNKEYVASYYIDLDKEETENGEPKSASFLILFDSNYQKICNLVNLENGFWGNIKDIQYENFVDLNDIEFIDIDNDGIMELIINIPTYEGTKISVVKYNKGNIKGEVDIKASVQP